MHEIAPTSSLIASRGPHLGIYFPDHVGRDATYFSIYCKLHARFRNTGGETRRKGRGNVAKRRHAAKLFVRPPPETRRRARYIYAKGRISGETGERRVNFKLDINRHEKVCRCDTFLPFSSTEVIRARFLEERNSPVNSATNMDKTREINDREINEGVKPLSDE